MFQFTTTNVINSDKDLTTGKNLWSAKSGSFHVKRVMDFKKPNVVYLYKAPYTDPVNAKVTLDLSKVTGATKGGDYRLSIYIRLAQSLQSSYYSNDMVFKGKPLSMEFRWQDTPANTAQKLVETFKKFEIAVYGKPIVNISYSGAIVTIDATDEYQRFYTVEIEKYDAGAYHGMGKYNVVAEAAEGGENFKIVQGKEGFGTYEWLLHNLRLPTTARTRVYAMNSDETPIPGAKYNQYTIHYCVNRGILGTNAVGDLVKSMTTHVIYVKSDLVAAFEASLKTAFGLSDDDLTVATGKTFKEVKIAADLSDVAADLESVAGRVETLENNA